jgi:hypothetical protein
LPPFAEASPRDARTPKRGDRSLAVGQHCQQRGSQPLGHSVIHDYLDDALLQVANRTDRMLRWLKVLESSSAGDVEGDITLEDLPESVRKDLKSANRVLRRLHDAALSELGQGVGH